MKKKVLVCFSENLETDDGFKSLTDKFSDEGFEVHLFDKVVDMQLKPHNVLNVLEHIWQEKIDENEYYFLSNIKDFFKLIYRCFHQSFKEFIFYSADDNIAYDVDLDDIYDSLLTKKFFPEENLNKKIYTNNIKEDFSNEYFNNNKEDIGKFRDDENGLTNNIQLIYRFQEQCFLLEPISGDTCYVNLDDEKVSNDVKYSDIIVPCELEKNSLKQAEDILELIAKDYETCLKSEEVVYKVFSFLRSEMLTSSKIEQKYYSALIETMGNSYGIYAKIFSLSFLLQIYRNSLYYKKLLLICLENKEINENNKYFILVQAKYVQLFDRRDCEEELLLLESKLFKEISSYFENNVHEYLAEFSERKVDDEKIVVMTSQFLDYTNLNSRYVLHICKYLIEEMGKSVWLVNTCEYLTITNRIPFFDTSAAYISGEYSNSNKINYDGVIIPYCQIVSSMPTDVGLAAIIDFLKKEEVSLILNTSELSLTAEIISSHVPVVNVLAEDKGLFVPIGQNLATNRKFSEEVLEIYSNYGLKIIPTSNSTILENITENNLLKNIIDKV